MHVALGVGGVFVRTVLVRYYRKNYIVKCRGTQTVGSVLSSQHFYMAHKSFTTSSVEKYATNLSLQTPHTEILNSLLLYNLQFLLKCDSVSSFKLVFPRRKTSPKIR